MGSERENFFLDVFLRPYLSPQTAEIYSIIFWNTKSNAMPITIAIISKVFIVSAIDI